MNLYNFTDSGESCHQLNCYFSVIILITRISGLRTFAKMSSFDFASTIAIGSILAFVVLNIDQPLLKGSLSLGGIVAFQSLFSFVVRKSKSVQKSLTNTPVALMYQEYYLTTIIKQM